MNNLERMRKALSNPFGPEPKPEPLPEPQRESVRPDPVTELMQQLDYWSEPVECNGMMVSRAVAARIEPDKFKS